MEEGELLRVDEALRLMCRDRNLAWVIDSVDAAINEGFAESVNPGSSAYGVRGSRWSFPGVAYDDDGSGRPQPQINQRPYTLQERVVLLLDAMLASYRDLPAIESAMRDTLSGGWDGHVTLVDSITFIGEDTPDGEPTEVPLLDESEDDRQRRQRVVDALLGMRREVMA